MEYVSGDPVLIKNIVTQLKSQGVFDQFRKECIADVDTKPAYQNLCHLADTQVSKFLSKVKWGPDANKNQIRENLRRQVNECNFVEPGIAIIVDQLVNPRINTVLVPKVEDMLYKYLGIPREITSEVVRKETKLFNDKITGKGYDSSNRGNSAYENIDKKKNSEKLSYVGDKSDVSSKTQPSAEKGREMKPYIKSEPADSNIKDTGKSIKSVESEKPEPKFEEREDPPGVQFDSESSDDEMSPPYEPHEKSDNDMSIGSGDSNYSEIIDPKTIESDIPIETEIENICKTEDPKIITEHEDSMDSIRSHQSTHSVAEKIVISPIEIPKTPTINYETSEDSDDNLKKKLLDPGLSLEACTEPLDIPEVNFDKIVEKVIEDDSENVKPVDKIDVFGSKPVKEEDSLKHKDKNRTDDPKKKHKHKDDKSKSVDKDKHADKKHERSDKDRSKHDKHKSEHRSKDRDKDKSRHDSKSHRKDDKSHRSKERDHKSDHDKKPRTDHKKDDRNEPKKDDKTEPKKDDKTEPKKDDKTEHKKDDRKRDDDKKHSRDDRKKDSRKSASDDKKPKSEDKHKHDKPRDEKKSKDGEHSHKSKKKDDDSKKSRTQCNVDEKKKTDRRSSDRDSSGPSASNSSVHTSSHHSSKSDKDKGTKHRHSSSSSSHKTKKNDDRDKDRNAGKPTDPVAKSENLASDKINDDDLEMILESSPEKASRDIRIDTHFAKKLETEIVAAVSAKANDHIEDMMNEIFQPTKPLQPVTSTVEDRKPQIPEPIDQPILKKPKIAKNFADIRRIMKLRKLYKESFKLKEEQGKENANLAAGAESSNDEKLKLRKTVEYFVTRRFGKNGSNVEKCKELTNAIMDTLTDVKLNITRVDRRYPIVDGTCILNDEKAIDENGLSSSNEDDSVAQHVEDLQIIHDERANLVLEDLAKSCTNPNFKLGDEPSPDDKLPMDSEDTEKALKIINSCPETKANGAKTKLPTQIKQKLLEVESIPQEVNLQMQINVVDGPPDDPSEDTSPSLKLKFKSTYDGKNKTWHACDSGDEIEDAVYCLSPPSTDERFKRFVEELIDNQLDIEVENLALEMEYPECYDAIFTSQLGAKIVRKRIADDSKTSPIKYNSEIINKKMGDKSIMLRIKKTSECDEHESKKLKKRKIDDFIDVDTNDGTVDLDGSVNRAPETENKKVPVKRKNEVKRKTLGIKRSLVSSIANSNSLKMKLTTEPIDKPESDVNSTNEQSPIDIKPKTISGLKKVKGKNKNKESPIFDINHKRSESESSDGRRSSVSSTGNTHCKNSITDATTNVTAKIKTKNVSNDSPNTDVATTTKATDPPKKANDTKSSEEKRKQSILNCYYDQSDLYKPRPTLRLTSRRYQNNADTN